MLNHLSSQICFLHYFLIEHSQHQAHILKSNTKIFLQPKIYWYRNIYIIVLLFTIIIIILYPFSVIFPSMHNAGHFSMLGLGDIVMPGLLLCFVMRYDNYKRQQTDILAPAPILPPNSLSQKVTYFHCSLIGYFIGEYQSNFASFTLTLCYVYTMFPAATAGPFARNVVDRGILAIFFSVFKFC